MPQKKYYWLKLKEDFFKSKQMKKLRKIAGGDTYTIIYLKMQLLGLKTGGVLNYEGIEDDIIEELSLELDETKLNIQATIIILNKWGLVEYYDENLFVPESIKNTGGESESLERVRKFREKKKALVDKNVTCNALVTKSNTEIEIEKEKETDKEKEDAIDIFKRNYRKTIKTKT
jgi:predicted phage replisome organizer